MGRKPSWVLVLPLLLVVACGDTDYSEGLEQPPTEGVPEAGPGSGENIAAHFHYTMQKNNPTIQFEDPSCPDVPVAEPGATVTCELSVDGERQEFLLTMDDDGIWQISDG